MRLRPLAVAGALLATVLVHPASAADTGEFKEYSFKGPKGSLTYKLYTPPTRGAHRRRYGGVPRLAVAGA